MRVMCSVSTPSTTLQLTSSASDAWLGTPEPGRCVFSYFREDGETTHLQDLQAMVVKHSQIFKSNQTYLSRTLWDTSRRTMSSVIQGLVDMEMVMATHAVGLNNCKCKKVNL